MAGNYVEILVKSRDEAKPDLEDLKAKLEELSHKVAQARVEVNDAGDAAKLDRMSAKLLELDHKTANPKIKMTGALRAEAEIHMVEASLDNLNRKEDETAVKTGLLGGVLGGLGSVMRQNMNLPLLPPMPVAALPAVIAGVAALVVELDGLASGFAAAGAGAGAFALLALPAIHSVRNAMTGVSTAQAAFNKADLLEKIAPSKAHLQALTQASAALKVAKAQLAGLGPDAAGAASGFQKLSDQFHSIAKAFQPEAFKIFNDLLKIANDLLPAVTPMAKAFANALDPLLKQFDKFTKSKGFQDWLKQFTSEIGPAVTAIGNGLAKAGPAIGKLLTELSKKDVVNAINIAFSVLTFTLNALGVAIRTAMAAWDGITRALHDGAHNFDTVRHAMAQAGHEIAHAFDAARHAVATAAHDIASGFDHVRHDIAAKFDGVKHDILSKFNGAVTWLKDKAHDIASGFDHVRHDIAAKFDNIRHDIAAKFSDAITWLVQAGKDVVQGLINGLNSMIPGLKSAVSTLVGIVKSIAGALGIHSPSTVMHGYGVAIVDGLINGMRSRMPDLRSQVGDISGVIGGLHAAGGGRGPGGGGLQLQVLPGGGSAFEQFMVASIRQWVRVKGGGSVQAAFGRS